MIDVDNTLFRPLQDFTQFNRRIRLLYQYGSKWRMLHTTRRILKRYKCYCCMRRCPIPPIRSRPIYSCPPLATMEMLKMFSNLYQWLTDGEITDRFLRQSLYEGGRPLAGKMMMKWGRLSLDYPSRSCTSWRPTSPSPPSSCRATWSVRHGQRRGRAAGQWITTLATGVLRPSAWAVPSGQTGLRSGNVQLLRIVKVVCDYFLWWSGCKQQ